MDFEAIRQAFIEASDRPITLEVIPAWREQGYSIGEILVRPSFDDPLSSQTNDLPILQIILDQASKQIDHAKHAPLVIAAPPDIQITFTDLESTVNNLPLKTSESFKPNFAWDRLKSELPQSSQDNFGVFAWSDQWLKVLIQVQLQSFTGKKLKLKFVWASSLIDEVHTNAIEQMSQIKEWVDNLPANEIIHWHSPQFTPDQPYALEPVDIGVQEIEKIGISSIPWTLFKEKLQDLTDPYRLSISHDAILQIAAIDHKICHLSMLLRDGSEYDLPPFLPWENWEEMAMQAGEDGDLTYYQIPVWTPAAISQAFNEWLAKNTNRNDITCAWNMPISHQDELGHICSPDVRDWLDNLTNEGREHTIKSMINMFEVWNGA